MSSTFASASCSFSTPKARYGGMDLSDARRLEQLEDENAKLKRLLADTMLDNVVLKVTELWTQLTNGDL